MSSSTARKVRKRLPVAQPLDVHVVPETLQLNAAVAVERDRYQRRSRIAQAAPVLALGRSWPHRPRMRRAAC